MQIDPDVGREMDARFLGFIASVNQRSHVDIVTIEITGHRLVIQAAGTCTIKIAS